jgi:uncharacterized RDD family membrane protein YckC
MVQLYSARCGASHPNLASELSSACAGLRGDVNPGRKSADIKEIDADLQETLRMMANPYAPPQAVVTDVVRDTGIVPADRGTRLGAVLLDSVIAGAMIMLPTGIAMAVALPMASTQQGNAAIVMLVVALLVFVAGFGVWGWLTFKFVNENGQTIAKKIIGIKVVRADGSPASLGRIFWLRNVVNVLLGVIPLYNLVEVLFIFGDERQCLHDKIADTIVVRA